LPAAPPDLNPPPQVPGSAPRDREELLTYFAAFTDFERQRALPTDRRSLGPRRCAHLIERAGGAPAGIVIQVAGSKGKGSTVLALEHLLRARGHTTIAAMSPHLERIEERLRIDGRESSPEELIGAVASLHPALRAIEAEAPELRPTFFDVMTASAVRAAASRGSDFLLLEVGLGGPLDSTSAVPPTAQILTVIDLEHRAQLGDTVEEIAAEKAGIAREGIPLIVEASADQEGRALEAARRVAEARGARLRLVAEDPRIPAGTLVPARRGLALATAALESIGVHPFTREELSAAAGELRLPGRLELLPGPPPLLLDGAHTIRSVRLFAERLAELRGDAPVTLLVGTMRDKEWRTALTPLVSDPGIHWIATSTEGARSTPAEELAAWLRSEGREVVPLPLDAAVQRLRAAPGTVRAVTGSFHLAGAVRSGWSNEPSAPPR